MVNLQLCSAWKISPKRFPSMLVVWPSLGLNQPLQTTLARFLSAPDLMHQDHSSTLAQPKLPTSLLIHLETVLAASLPSVLWKVGLGRGLVQILQHDWFESCIERNGKNLHTLLVCVNNVVQVWALMKSVWTSHSPHVPASPNINKLPIFHSFVVDGTPPVIENCPENFSETTPLNSGGRTVTYVSPTATDNSGISTLAERSHFPGQYFVTGATTVTYRFVDPSGNEAICSFVITVIEG